MKKYIVYTLLLFMIGFQAYAIETNHTDSVPSMPSSTAEELTPQIGHTSKTKLALLWAKANEEYTQGKYTDALTLYETIVKSKQESAELYFNIANTYFKLNEIPQSILYYERALLLNPKDKDTRFNLEMAKLKTIDKIELVDSFFLKKWIVALKTFLSSNQWAVLAISTFIAFLLFLSLYLFAHKMFFRKLGFYLACCLLVISVVGNIFAFQQKNIQINKEAAIIFAPTVTLKGSPSLSETDIVVLHEGTKVFIKSRLGEWCEVSLENGTIGWIENNKIEII